MMRTSSFSYATIPPSARWPCFRRTTFGGGVLHLTPNTLPTGLRAAVSVTGFDARRNPLPGASHPAPGSASQLADDVAVLLAGRDFGVCSLPRLVQRHSTRLTGRPAYHASQRPWTGRRDRVRRSVRHDLGVCSLALFLRQYLGRRGSAGPQHRGPQANGGPLGVTGFDAGRTRFPPPHGAAAYTGNCAAGVSTSSWSVCDLHPRAVGVTGLDVRHSTILASGPWRSSFPSTSAGAVLDLDPRGRRLRCSGQRDRVRRLPGHDFGVCWLALVVRQDFGRGVPEPGHQASRLRWSGQRDRVRRSLPHDYGVSSTALFVRKPSALGSPAPEHDGGRPR